VRSVVSPVYDRCLVMVGQLCRFLYTKPGFAQLSRN
jgi:hypothetical protein